MKFLQFIYQYFTQFHCRNSSKNIWVLGPFFNQLATSFQPNFYLIVTSRQPDCFFFVLHFLYESFSQVILTEINTFMFKNCVFMCKVYIEHTSQFGCANNQTIALTFIVLPLLSGLSFNLGCAYRQINALSINLLCKLTN